MLPFPRSPTHAGVGKLGRPRQHRRLTCAGEALTRGEASVDMVGVGAWANSAEAGEMVERRGGLRARTYVRQHAGV